MNRAKHYLLYIIVGAVAHWVPDILIQWLFPPNDTWIKIRTISIPVIVGIAWDLLARHPSHSRFYLGIPLFMLLGIWLLGPFGMALAIFPDGGKVVLTKDLLTSPLFWTLIPILTFTMSMSTKSSGGLALTTLALLAAGGLSTAKRKYSDTKFPDVS